MNVMADGDSINLCVGDIDSGSVKIHEASSLGWKTLRKGSYENTPIRMAYQNVGRRCLQLSEQQVQRACDVL